MNTLARVQALAKAAAGFPELSPPDERDLLEVVRLELGHAEILDDFQEYGGHLARALAPRTILHIVSGNTPHAALQTMIRGLLLGADNLVKFPAAGLGEIERFADRLPPELGRKLACARTLDVAWLDKADAWVVFGDDRTISHFRACCPAGKIFQAHGPRVSLAVVFSELDSCSGLARDVSLFDQLGCLSPQAVYVAGDAVGLAARLAAEIERYLVRHPAGPLALEDAAAVAHVRETALFEEAAGTGVRVWQGETGGGWTVVFDPDPAFRGSPLHRFVWVKPLSADLGASLGPVRSWLGAVGIHPATPENARQLVGLGASRLCAVGRMQEPSFTWHAEGRPNLADLVQWVDFEP